MNSLKYVRPGKGYEPKFPLMAKGDVNGKNQQDIFKFLKIQKPSPEDRTCEMDIEEPYGIFNASSTSTHVVLYSPTAPSDIEWNFAKFIIDQEGNVIHRFSPKTPTLALEKYIEALL